MTDKPDEPDTPAMTVIIGENSTHEGAAAATAWAAGALSLMLETPTPGRLLIRAPAHGWIHDPNRRVDVRVASNRYLRAAVQTARLNGVNHQEAWLAGSRAVAFEPLPAFNATREVQRTAPLVLDLPRDTHAYYSALLADNEDRQAPAVVTLRMRSTKTTVQAVELAAMGLALVRYSLDVQNPRLVGESGLLELERWRTDGFRSELTFAEPNEIDDDADCELLVNARSAR